MIGDITSDPVRLAVAICPLAAYLSLIGLINLRSVPFLTSGGRDLLALSIGLSGLALIGPVALVTPSWSIDAYGAYAFPLMFALYFLVVIFIVLTRRPRLIAYNTTIQKVRPLLREVAEGLDPAARWAGESVFLPSLKIHLILEEDYGTRNVQFNSVGGTQNFAGWRQLEVALANQMRQSKDRRMNPYGFFLVGIATFMMVAVCAQVFAHGNFVSVFLHEFYLGV